DSPGIHKARSALNTRIVKTSLAVLDDADLILLLVDGVRADRESLVFGDRRVALDGRRSTLLDGLREALQASPTLAPDAGLPFEGGLVGVAAYDIVRNFENVPASAPRPAGAVDGAWIAPESMLVFDHLTRRAALLHAGPQSERAALRREVIRALAGGIPFRRPGSVGPAGASMSETEFTDAVAKAKGNITAGDVFQLVLSVRFSGRTDIAPFEAYRALRLLNPSPYMYFLEMGELSVAGSSPEALVKLHGREASLRPIAGTRPRGDTEAVDVSREEELLADPKENAEHVMLVDLARNDLGRVAVPGTVRVDPSRAIERYSHVMHIVSGVVGELEAGRDALDLFAATFPAGTLVGAPKVRAMELIDEYEPVARGLYAGTVGYFARGGNMDQAIAIRTLVFEGDEYSFQAGAGIVADSVPINEHREVMAKSAILRRALEMAEEGL
ncbi:MAG: anthranilate synthase component I family protein, partial [Anaerolineae bacterium]